MFIFAKEKQSLSDSQMSLEIIGQKQLVNQLKVK